MPSQPARFCGLRRMQIRAEVLQTLACNQIKEQREKEEKQRNQELEGVFGGARVMCWCGSRVPVQQGCRSE